MTATVQLKAHYAIKFTLSVFLISGTGRGEGPGEKIKRYCVRLTVLATSVPALAQRGMVLLPI